MGFGQAGSLSNSRSRMQLKVPECPTAKAKLISSNLCSYVESWIAPSRFRLDLRDVQAGPRRCAQKEAGKCETRVCTSIRVGGLIGAPLESVIKPVIAPRSPCASNKVERHPRKIVKATIENDLVFITHTPFVKTNTLLTQYYIILRSETI
jgi:hypothetical protein